METIVEGGVDSGDISRERAARAVEVMMVSDVSDGKGRSSGVDGGGGGGSSGGGSNGGGSSDGGGFSPSARA